MGKRRFGLSQVRRRLVLGILLLSGAGLVCFPQPVTQAAKEGVEQCLTVVIPSLFPFLVLSSLLISLGFGASLGRRLHPIMSLLFHVSGGGGVALILGLVGGYPVGARTTAELYQAGLCSRQEASRLLMFCNNCGPAFLLSTAGVAVFGSSRAGLILWGGHLLSALAIGLLLPAPNGVSSPEPPAQPAVPPLSVALTNAVTGAARSVLHLSAFVVLFGVVIRLLNLTHLLAALSTVLYRLLGLPLADGSVLLSGSLELTGGILALTGRSPTPGALALAAFLLAWGGVSVHCQTMAVLQGTDLPLTGYLIGKLCHGLLASAITWLLARHFPQPQTLTTLVLRTGVSPSLSVLAGIGWLCVAALCILARKRGGKIVRNRL